MYRATVRGARVRRWLPPSPFTLGLDASALDLLFNKRVNFAAASAIHLDKFEQNTCKSSRTAKLQGLLMPLPLPYTR